MNVNTKAMSIDKDERESKLLPFLMGEQTIVVSIATGMEDLNKTEKRNII